jgi:two-component system vancomycin resistance associated response regulator VraR
MRWGAFLQREGGKRMNLKIALMDEYSLALQGLYDGLKMIPDFEIVGAFTKTEELLACLEEKIVDIVIVDLMPKANSGFGLLEQIYAAQNQKIKIIVLVSGGYNKIMYERGMEMGVKAFLPKNTSLNEMVSAIISVGKGNDVVPDEMMEEQHNQILTETEIKVLALVVQEYTNDRIAKELFISRRTVESYVSSICNKLGVDSRIGAVREAIRLKLI